MAAQIFLHGLALSGYRSFGSKLQRIGPFGAINLFAGPNNAGKSNILRFIHHHLVKFCRTSHPTYGTIELRPDDRHQGKATLTVGIAGRLDSLGPGTRLENQPFLITRLKELFSSQVFHADNGLFWFDYSSDSNFSNLSPNLSFNVKAADFARANGIDNHSLRELWSIMSNKTGGDRAGWIDDICAFVSTKKNRIEDVCTVPAFRSINSDDGGMSKEVLNGNGLIIELAKLEQFTHDQRAMGERFDKIQRFFRSGVGDSDAKLWIPFQRNTIAVTLGGRDLTLESLGTGIHQTVLLAAMGTIIENQIVCIEEPETHLHPVFQRKLLRYLAAETSNQYFIATHSAHLLDCGISDVSAVTFSVRLEDGASVVDRVSSGTDRANICRDLGYHASDLVQSNCVVWVEGPSDRIYLKHWIAAVDPSLVEGIHFSVMFYGGSLLCYLTGNDEEGEDEFKEFVALRRLNRNAVIVMDSDRTSAKRPIGEHKKRIVGEFENDGIAWVTAGRTIENYLSKEARTAAFLVAHPNSGSRVGGGGRFDTVKKGGGDFGKVKMAKAAVAKAANLDVLDLKERIDQVVTFIRSRNPAYGSLTGQ